jgi:hypothetical protein
VTGAPGHRPIATLGSRRSSWYWKGAPASRSDDDVADVRAGQSLVLPAGSRHAFTNVGPGTLRILAVFAAATPPVEYEGEPGVLEIGGAGGVRRDAHRAYRAGEAP